MIRAQSRLWTWRWARRQRQQAPDRADLQNGLDKLRDHEKRKANWDAAQVLHATQLATWQAPGSDPAKPAGAEPQPPTGGDIAVGSGVRDAQGLVIDAKSHLGKVSSKWAIARRDLLNDTDAKGNPIGPITRMDNVLTAYDAAIAAKNTAICARLAFVVDPPMLQPVTGVFATVWTDSRSGQTGTPIDNAGFRAFQADIWKEGVAGNMDNALMKAASVDKLAGDDIARLRKTVANWRVTLKVYRDALKTLDDGPVNPSNV